MSRKLAFYLFTACVGASAFAGAARAESYTTRIETRPFYGAVVTLEEGVRVFRALPPDRQVIINPNGTPLTLGFNETRVYGQGSGMGYNGGDGGVSVGGDTGLYSYPLYGRRFYNRGRGVIGHHPGFHQGLPRGGIGGTPAH